MDSSGLRQKLCNVYVGSVFVLHTRSRAEIVQCVCRECVCIAFTVSGRNCSAYVERICTACTVSGRNCAMYMECVCTACTVSGRNCAMCMECVCIAYTVSDRNCSAYTIIHTFIYDSFFRLELVQPLFQNVSRNFPKPQPLH